MEINIDISGFKNNIKKEKVEKEKEEGRVRGEKTGVEGEMLNDLFILCKELL